MIGYGTGSDRRKRGLRTRHAANPVCYMSRPTAGTANPASVYPKAGKCPAGDPGRPLPAATSGKGHFDELKATKGRRMPKKTNEKTSTKATGKTGAAKAVSPRAKPLGKAAPGTSPHILTEGMAAPAFRLTGDDGGRGSLKDFAGRTLV